jgi:hypothetical protein
MAERHLKLLSDEFNFNKCFFTKSFDKNVIWNKR